MRRVAPPACPVRCNTVYLPYSDVLRVCLCVVQVGADQAQETTMNQLRGLKTEVRLLADQLQTIRAMTEALIRKNDIDWEAEDQYQFE